MPWRICIPQEDSCFQTWVSLSFRAKGTHILKRDRILTLGALRLGEPHGGKWLSDLPRGHTGERVLEWCYVREEERQRPPAFERSKDPQSGLAIVLLAGYYRQPPPTQGVILKVSRSIRGILGWGNLRGPCQAPLDCLRTLGEV